jgi:hypothetical protein
MRRLRSWLAAVLVLGLLPLAAQAVSFTFEGTTPDTGDAFRFTADLSISGDTLTLVLSNDSMSLSPASPSLHPDDLLTAFYFDIYNGSTRPTLTYTGASGDVCLADKDATDDCSVVDKENDLRATAAGDATWQFRQGLSYTQGGATLTYGVGTAGNVLLTPNNFNGSIVGQWDYGIYAGDVTTTQLDPPGGSFTPYLVANSITFTWSGATGYSDADIDARALFGLGTAPDSTAFVPEPTTGLLLGMGLVGLAWRGRRR